MSRSILLVDDDAQALESMRKILELSGYQVTTAVDGQVALDLIRPKGADVGARETPFDLVLTDVRMPRLGGLEFLRALSLCVDVPVILMTAFGRVEDAVWAMKLGAVDFLTKPFKRQALITAIEAALKRGKARAQGGQSQAGESSELLLGASTGMRDLRRMVEQVAPTAASVLIHGESGTGKELVARCLHLRSNRARAPFVAVNCAAIPEQLIESELFGFEKGAFTGATGQKEGLFEAADGGTLLLDEIGDMPLAVQAKLLRVLQESEVRRIGATSSRKIDVRVIAATHKDLADCVQAGTFRQDLLFRLEVVGIRVPALRDRTDDIAELSAFFLSKAAKRHEKALTGFTQEALAALRAHAWPGNVRELSNVIERAAIFAGTESGEIALVDLPKHVQQACAASHPVSHPSSQQLQSTGRSGSIEIPLGTSLKDVEEILIRKTLEATDGDKNTAARLLGINSRTIYRRLEQRGEREADPVE